MLKIVCISTLLWSGFFIGYAQAQDNDQQTEDTDDNKRPSWSSGLPERQKSADLSKPEFKAEIDNDIELDMSEFGLKPKAEIELDLPINSDLTGIPTVQPENDAQQAAIEELAREQQALEQAAQEQEALELAAREQEALEQAALEQKALEQAAIEQAALEQAALEQAAREQEALEQAALEQAALEQAAREQEALEQIAVQQTDTEQPELLNSDSSSEQDVVAVPEEQRIASVEPPIDNQAADFSSDVAVEQQEYSWNIIERAPVSYPVKAAIENLEGWVEVEITINSAGEVVSASPIKYSRRGRIFGKPAVQSVQKWLFEPPSAIGINSNQTRVYKVEFDL